MEERTRSGEPAAAEPAVAQSLPVHAAMVTLDFTLPEIAEATSPVTTFVIQ